jgi:hypothetical protein
MVLSGSLTMDHLVQGLDRLREEAAGRAAETAHQGQHQQAVCTVLAPVEGGNCKLGASRQMLVSPVLAVLIHHKQ